MKTLTAFFLMIVISVTSAQEYRASVNFIDFPAEMNLEGINYVVDGTVSIPFGNYSSWGAEIDFAYAAAERSLGGNSFESVTSFSNPYVGLNYQLNDAFDLNFGANVPLRFGNASEASTALVFSNVTEDTERGLCDYLPVRAGLSYDSHKGNKDAGGFGFELNGGAALWTRLRAQTNPEQFELQLPYSAFIKAKNFEGEWSVGLLGRYDATSDLSLARATKHAVRVSLSFPVSIVDVGFVFETPVDDDLESKFSKVIGFNIGYRN